MKHTFISSFALVFALALGAQVAFAEVAPTPTPTDHLNLPIGTEIQTTANLNVRETPSKSGAFIAVKPTGSRGKIEQGPVTSTDGYVWYYVNYEIGADGWNVSGWLNKISTTTITTGSSTAAITSFTATPNVVTADQSVTLKWKTTGVNRCWLVNSTNFTPYPDLNPQASSFTEVPKWELSSHPNRTMIVYTLNCQDTMSKTKSIVTATVPITLASSTAHVATTTPKDKFGLGIGTPIEVTDTLNVRQTPSIYGAFLGEKAKGSRGVIKDGPRTEDGRVWYYVDYEFGVDGWNASGRLANRVSTSITTTHATATISHFTANPSVVTSDQPVTLSWATQGVLSCTLYNSSDLSLPPIRDINPSKTTYTVTPNWRIAGHARTSITYTLRCQDAASSVKKLVEANTTITRASSTVATGNITSVTTGITPTVSGTAYGTATVNFTIQSAANNPSVTYESGDLAVTNNKWSQTVTTSLTPGQYTVTVYANGTELNHRSMTVVAPTTAS